MKQGEIWMVNLDPSMGSEQAGFRPVVILSGDLLNTYLKVVIVAPLTTKVKGYKGNPILEPTKENGLKSKSEILIFHIRSVSKERLVSKVGSVDESVVQQSVKTLNDILRY